jgi:predicted kinase
MGDIMKKLILIGGSLASGKSTYSMILKEKYNLTVINKDKLKEILGDNILVKTREENKKLSVISFELMMYLLECNESCIVLESNFKDYELKVLKEKCEKLNYSVLSLFFDGNNEILHKRFNERLNQNRHYVHKSQDFTSISNFIEVLDDLRKAEYFGKIINVDCTNFNYQQDEKLFKEIEEFIKGN